MALSIRPSLIPASAAAVAGMVVALAAIAMPTVWLEAAAIDSGITALLPAAEPPLGATARAVLALGGGLGVAAVVWSALYLLFGPGGPLARVEVASGVQIVRRADAHPDAPPRRPLSAAELPATPPPIARPLPKDLDVPLAAFDPAAVPPMPLEPVRPVKSLTPVLAPGERLETFTLTPPPPPAPRAASEPPSIDALLRRLEQGAQRRVMAG